MTCFPTESRQAGPAAEQVLNRLAEVCAKLAQGDYAEAKELFAFTISGEYPELVAHLAESFGMMLVKVEAREYQLGKTIADLNEACRELARGQSSLSRENKKLREDLASRQDSGKIIGQSPGIRLLLQQAERAAQVDATVLITGETGSGKGMLARRLHYGGARAKGPFVAINCAAIPSSLLESELFGIEKGVASGVDARIGRFEQANGGTIFLDEIGDMPLESQAKILHVIESGTVERIGGRRTIPINVRIIAATHRDLTKACEAREFRSDLYYRLNVIRLYIPSLRERREDIPLLARHFLQVSAGRHPIVAEYFTPEALRILQAYPWPGNIRELENEVERAALLSMSAGITPQDLSPTLAPLDGVNGRDHAFQAPLLPPPRLSSASQPAPPAASLPTPPSPARRPPAPAGNAAPLPSLDAAERDLVNRALAQAGGNKSETARTLGISREGLRKKLKRLGLRD